MHTNRSQASASRVVPSLAEWSVSRYDEAIVSLGFMVRSMNFDLKLAPQVLLFSITSKPKSIEIPWRPPRTKRLPSNGCIESELLRSKPTEPVAPVRFRYSTSVCGKWRWGFPPVGTVHPVLLVLLTIASSKAMAGRIAVVPHRHVLAVAQWLRRN